MPVGDFPTIGIDSFATLTDGVNTVLAEHQNDRAAAVVATQTKVGADTDTRAALSVEGRLRHLSSGGRSRYPGTVASAGTLAALPDDYDTFRVTGTTTISTIPSPGYARLVYLEFAAALTLDHGAGNVNLAGGADYTVAAEEVVALEWNGTSWHQVAPSSVPTGLTRVASDVAFTSTTLGTVTGLSATVAAGSTYFFEAHLYVTADATGGQQYAIGGTATATAVVYDTIIGDLTAQSAPAAARATALGTATALAGNTHTVFDVTLRGTITVNAGGTLVVQAAQDSASGTTTVLRGSTFRVQAMA